MDNTKSSKWRKLWELGRRLADKRLILSGIGIFGKQLFREYNAKEIELLEKRYPNFSTRRITEALRIPKRYRKYVWDYSSRIDQSLTQGFLLNLLPGIMLGVSVRNKIKFCTNVVRMILDSVDHRGIHDKKALGALRLFFLQAARKIERKLKLVKKEKPDMSNLKKFAGAYRRIKNLLTKLPELNVQTIDANTIIDSVLTHLAIHLDPDTLASCRDEINRELALDPLRNISWDHAKLRQVLLRALSRRFYDPTKFARNGAAYYRCEVIDVFRTSATDLSYTLRLLVMLGPPDSPLVGSEITFNLNPSNFLRVYRSLIPGRNDHTINSAKCKNQKCWVTFKMQPDGRVVLGQVKKTLQ